MFNISALKIKRASGQLFLICCMLLVNHALGQTRIFFSAGTMASSPYGGVYYEDDDSQRLGFISKFGLPAIDLTVENRITGPLYAYWGLGYVQLLTEDFDTNPNSQTEYKQSYVTTPLMLRLNVANRNLAYFDFGVVPSYLLSGNLKEVSTDGLLEDEGSIANKIPRFDLLFRFSNSFAIKRISLGYRVDVKLTKKYAAQFNELKESWELGSDSSFIRNYDGNAFQLLYGVFVGYRLK